MIKEQNRQIILFIAFISTILAIITRIIYEIKLIIDHPYFAGALLFIVSLFIVPLVLFFLTFHSPKNRGIELLIIICIIELAQFLVGIRFGNFRLINYIENIIYISPIILSIFLIVNTKLTKNLFDIIKLIIIGILSIIYMRLIFGTINISYTWDTLLSIAYFFAFISMVLVVIQINPSSIPSKNPTKYFYINSIYNLILILAFNNVLFGYIEGIMLLDIQLIFILMIISVQGILLFYNKNIASFIVHLIGVSLLTIYIFGTEMEVMRLVGSLIFLVIGFCLDFVFILKEKKNKVIYQD